MTQASNISRSLLLALPLTLCSALALAAPAAQEQSQSLRSDLHRVEVSGHRPRLDVRATCPSADQTIQEALAAVVAREGEAALSTVKFKLKGSNITEVTATNVSSAYRQAVRTAVHRLDCAGNAEEQTFSFQIRFTPFGEDTASDRGYAVAVLTQ